MSRLLDGRKVQEEMRELLAQKVNNFSSIPTLIIFQVGENSASDLYIKRKGEFGAKIGVSVEVRKFGESVSEAELIAEIQKATQDEKVGGIIVQLPLPKHLDPQRVVEAISPDKDVDGLTSANVKALFDGTPLYIPATTRGILTLLDYYHIEVEGKRVVIVGRSKLVGKPTAVALLNKGATVTVCHRQTQNLKEETKRADILISATGVPHLITKDYVREGQVVIDVGINKLNGKTVGDVDFDGVKDIVEAITPVPGGVGPLTVLSLFQNLLKV